MAIVKNNFRVSRLDSAYSPGSTESVSTDEDELQTRSSISETESDPESASDVDSGAASDDFDLSDLGEIGAEFCQYGNQNCSVPLDLYDLPDLSDVLSLDTWNSCLTEDERFYLAQFLPDMDQETFIRTLKELFSGGNFHFGSPLVELFNQLKGGLCEPRVALCQQGLKFLEKKRHYHLLQKYQNAMVSSLMQMKNVWDNSPGYSHEKRIHVLRTRRKRGLRDEEGERLCSVSDASEKEESSEGFWNKKIKDVSLGSKPTKLPNQCKVLPKRAAAKFSVNLEAMRYGKPNPKGLSKFAVPKNPSRDHGMFEKKSIHTSSQFGTHQLDQPRRHAFGSVRKSRQQFIYNGDVAEEAHEIGRKQNKIVETAKSFKSEKKQRKLGEETDSYFEYPLSFNDSLYTNVKTRDSEQIANAEAYTAKPVKDKFSYDCGSFIGGKRAKYQETLQCAVAEEWMEPAKVKGNCNGKSNGNSSYKSNKMPDDPYSIDHYATFDDSPVRRKKWKVGEEFTALTISRRYAQNGLAGVEDYFGHSMKTYSDSSDQVDKDEEFNSSSRKFRNPNGVHSSSVKQRYDPKLRKQKRQDKKERIKGMDERLPAPEIEIFTSKGKQKLKSSGSRHYCKTFEEEKYGPASAKLIDDDMQFKLGKNNKTRDDSDEIYHPLPKTSAGKKRKGRINLEFSAPNHNHEEEEDLHGRIQFGSQRKKIQNKEICLNETDTRELFNAPLLSCKSATGKRKAKVDKTYFDSSDVSDQLQTKSSQPVNDSSSVKKNGKKKVEAVTKPMTTSEVITTEEMGDVELETKPSNKQFLLITPTVHTGFSFSIIHLLSAVRTAMNTPSLEDVIEKNDKIGKLMIGSAKEGPISFDIMDINVANVEQKPEKNLPSLTVQEIVNQVRSNPGDPCILETQEPLQDLVRGVLKIFSAKTAPLGAKGWKALVLYEKATRSWSWVGPIPSILSENDPVEDETSAAAWAIPHRMLVKLVDAFANWLKSGQETLQQIGSLPAPPITLLPSIDEKERFRDLRAQKSLITISPSSDEMRAYFRKEEVLRYSVPNRAFSYTAADGRKSIVAPLRRCGGKPTSKARDHFMLKPDRPPHVTILCLVRDAAARLPGSIGTRADVCTLMRDSLYIVEDVSDAQVNQVVSGALDRLHYERDPCVQFDAERKLWVYLHRDREEEDFEDDGTSSTKKWKRQRKDGASDNFDVEAGNDIVDYPESGDQVAGGLHADLGDALAINAAPSANYEQGKEDLVCNDLKTNIDGKMEPFANTANGSMHNDHSTSWEVLGLNHMQDKNILCQKTSINKDFEDEGFGRERPLRILSTGLT